MVLGKVSIIYFYIKPDTNGGDYMRNIKYNQIPDRAFIPVVQMIEIYKATPLTREEKQRIERGGPDIKLVEPSGLIKLASRKDVLANYTYLDDSPIKIGGWTHENKYTIKKRSGRQGFAMMIPTSLIVTDIERANKRGSYIVCDIGEDGYIDRETARVIGNNIFKKMYTIPYNEEIYRIIRGEGKRPKAQKIEIERPVDFGINNEGFNALASEINNHTDAERPKDVNGLREEREAEPQRAAEESGGTKARRTEPTKIRAINRIMVGETLVGFIVQNERGQTRQVNTVEMMGLCKNKAVTNISLARHPQTEKAYLRGNGIKIGDLPPHYIN